MFGIDQHTFEAKFGSFCYKNSIPLTEGQNSLLSLIAVLYRSALEETFGKTVIEELDNQRDHTIYETRFKEFRSNPEVIGSLLRTVAKKGDMTAGAILNTHNGIEKARIETRENLIKKLAPFYLIDTRIQRDLGLLFKEKLEFWLIGEDASQSPGIQNEAILSLHWALCYLNFASAQNDLEAAVALGDVYLLSTQMTCRNPEQSILVEPERKAFELYFRAAQAGHEGARERLSADDIFETSDLDLEAEATVALGALYKMSTQMTGNYPEKSISIEPKRKASELYSTAAQTEHEGARERLLADDNNETSDPSYRLNFSDEDFVTEF